MAETRKGPISIAERSRGVWDADAVVVNFDAATRSAALTPGVYYLTSTQACRYIQGGSTVVVTTGNYLPANCPVMIVVSETTVNGYVSIIKQTDAGSAYISCPKGTP